MTRVAVIGAGIAGLAAARTLALAGLQVVLYEKEDNVGGHARTVQVDGVSLDLGFMVFNRVTYPNMLKLFDDLGVEVEESDMSFSISLDEGRGWEWSSNGLLGLFAQRKNLLNPYFLRMIKEIIKFQQDVIQYLDSIETDDDRNYVKDTLETFVKTRGYSNEFLHFYLVPMCASIWSCPTQHVLQSSAVSILTFCRNHHLLQISGRPQWMTVKGRSQSYVTKVVEELRANGCDLRVKCTVTKVFSSHQQIHVEDAEGHIDVYDQCVIGAHAPDALELLGSGATTEERTILGAFQYIYSDIYLHRDSKYMPKNTAAWSAWNFLGCKNKGVCLTYWLNKLQNLGNTGRPFLVTLNPGQSPQDSTLKWTTSHPIPLPAAAVASRHLDSIQGRRGIWFCGAYQGYGFHEDGLKSQLVSFMETFQQLAKPKMQELLKAPTQTPRASSQGLQSQDKATSTHGLVNGQDSNEQAMHQTIRMAVSNAGCFGGGSVFQAMIRLFPALHGFMHDNAYGAMQAGSSNPMYGNIGVQPGFQCAAGSYGMLGANMRMAGFSQSYAQNLNMARRACGNSGSGMPLLNAHAYDN
ncbi:hypothetical protein L7F22_055697 [Adiantum nelumboides]|nr:hypothetical protein [Adiantum nelumboides]